MPSVKGKGNGGKRPGAGRPVAKRSLRATNKFYVSRKYPDGILPGEIWEVKKVTRSAIVLQSSDGSTITMVN